ncbi:hypothetical protein DICPUDRAFT_159955 [Dictyostelium purpureum]|uniref:ABC3 transporter permease C-terminal domain-containing protein n=1 Tax=Dictyostelium purpureum TaxID=5786 RepID=F1A5D1_DICPU|nr:uncharacterized protein DICPUDRAFT_159955 [Dictyostelium purpureum]EGC28601.1 hypothetical protein DICPUDRAFT_159955 [Dictyostelium purpureum]|eukprot:XP_003294875.1 hypothetical protein DICPUDRAFT_159955 [Dictyostelium purpureum]
MNGQKYSLENNNNIYYEDDESDSSLGSNRYNKVNNRQQQQLKRSYNQYGDDDTNTSNSSPNTDSPFLKSSDYSLNNSNNNNNNNNSSNKNSLYDDDLKKYYGGANYNSHLNDDDGGSFSFDLNTIKGFLYYIYFSLRYTLYGDFRVALKYVHNNSKKNRKSLLLGLFTVFLVVLFISFLQNLIQSSPIVFLKLSEDQAGELDLVLTGDPGNYYSSGNTTLSLDVVNTDSEELKYSTKLKKSNQQYRAIESNKYNQFNNVSELGTTGLLGKLFDSFSDQLGMLNQDFGGFFVNSTFLNHTLNGASTVHGVAPRWVSISDINTNQTLTNDTSITNSASLLVMVMNTTLEKEMGLGRGWKYPPLVGNQIHITSSFLRRINIQPNKNQAVHLHMDFFDVLQRLGISSSTPTFDSFIDSIESQLGFPIPEQLNVTTAIEMYDFLNPNAHLDQVLENLLGPNAFVISDDGMVLYPVIALKELYDSVRNDLSLDQDLIVMDSIESPGGKFPDTIGNVGILESSFVESMIKEKLDNVNNQLNNTNLNQLIAALEASADIINLSGVNITSYLDRFNSFKKTFNKFHKNFNINFYAMSPVIMLENRVKVYIGSDDEMKVGMMEFTNQVSTLLGYSYPVSFTTPLATTLKMFVYTKLSLNQIFNCVACVLLVLGALMVYSLLLSDVEGKTFEYGMLRAQGMRQYALIILLLTQSLYFSIPGIMFGLFIGWCLYAVVAYFVYVQFVLLPIDLTYHSTSIISGLAMGFLMPIVANIAPIQRALSRTLRDALDVYHQVKNETMVKIEKLEEIGLDVLQTILAILAVAVGFTVYYLIPLSFTFRNLGLFFGILTGILMGMLFGMSMLAQAVQPFLEKAIVFSIILGPDRRSLYSLVRKNLFSHSTRNSKTATMLTICLTFIIFTGCVFRLQGHNIQELVRLGIGSDVGVVATSIRNPIPEIDIRNFLDNDIANNTNSIVANYTVVSFPLDKVMNIRSTQLMPLAQYPSINVRIYGVESNFLKSTFTDFYQYTELADSLKFPNVKVDGKEYPDVIDSLYVNQHKELVPEDIHGKIVPPPMVVSNGSVTYQKANPIWNWLKHHLDNGNIYTNYTDIIFSEAFRLTCGVDTNSPFNLNVRFKQYSNNYATLTLLAKGQAMVRMFPSFFFSSYSQTAYSSPVLVNNDEFYRIMKMVYSLTSDQSVVLPEVVPKSKVLVKFKEGSTLSEREYIINGIRNFIKTDNIQVMDTQHLLDTTSTAVTILNIFFYTVSVASIILCFFMLWVSFSANIHENCWEFGVLRSIGLTSFQVTRIYIYEALVLIFSSMVLGLIIGLGVALTLTLQFDLFTELPLSFEFPYFWFIGVLLMSIGLAIIVSYQSSKEYRERMIASVLKGL